MNGRWLIFGAVLILAGVAPGQEHAGGEAKAPPGGALRLDKAQEAHDRAVAEAEQAFRQAVLHAKQEYLTQVKAALKSAFREENLEGAHQGHLGAEAPRRVAPTSPDGQESWSGINVTAPGLELRWSTPDLLEALGVVRKQGDQLKPTVAGVLLFGTSLALRKLFPMMRIDYIRIPFLLAGDPAGWYRAGLMHRPSEDRP